MLLAHLGVAVFITGVTLVKSYESEKDVRLAAGKSAELGGYIFRLDAINEVKGSNYVAARGTFTVTEGGAPVGVIYPEKRIYRVQRNPMTEAAINTRHTRDLYISMGEPVSDTAWLVRLQVKPFVDWIWGGCVLMALGGLLAMIDRRYRVAARVPQMRLEGIVPQSGAVATEPQS